MSKSKKVIALIFFAIILLGAKKTINNKPLYQGEIQAPIQEDLDETKALSHWGRVGKVVLYPVAKYKIQGVVKSKKKYKDYSSQISQYDLALAWGKLNKKEINDFITYSQSGRWFHYKHKSQLPVSGGYISENSSNTHIIHKNDSILKQVKNIKEGDFVELEGYLVDVDFQDPNANGLWLSSRTRQDQGNGACEILYVEKVTVKQRPILTIITKITK